jgi:hypothetical protein
MHATGNGVFYALRSDNDATEKFKTVGSGALCADRGGAT